MSPIISDLRYNAAVQNVSFIAAKAREVSARFGMFSTDAKNEILLKIAERLKEDTARILKANAKDVAVGKRKGLSEGLLDRLLLTKERMEGIIADVRNIAGLKDYVGSVIEERELPNGLFLRRLRVPLGVVAMIYEARPNVTVDAACLCLKSGNAVILKGGSDAINSNRAIVSSIQSVLKETSFLEPTSRLQDLVQLVDSTDYAVTKELLSLNNFIDVVIPRGSMKLINFVRENSRIPVIETGASVVHAYIHEDADVAQAVQIIMNAKLRRVSICNTLDTLLVHKKIAPVLLKALVEALPKNQYKADHLELRADAESFGILRKLSKPKEIAAKPPHLSAGGRLGLFELNFKKSTPQDYSTEFLDYILAIKTVRSLDEALNHISHHSLRHSEAIVTADERVAQRFLQSVDAACVYWNASTQFSDGGQFGLGAEIGISTQKLHARGPFALEGLTSYKWVIEGNGQIRTP